jgi:hypothetical protein
VRERNGTERNGGQDKRDNTDKAAKYREFEQQIAAGNVETVAGTVIIGRGIAWTSRWSTDVCKGASREAV